MREPAGPVAGRHGARRLVGHQFGRPGQLSNRFPCLAPVSFGWV